MSQVGRAAVGKQSVFVLNLSTRGRCCMENARIATIGDLLLWSPEELLRVGNLGRKTLSEIASQLASLGLRLKSDGAWPPRVPPGIRRFSALRYPDIVAAWEYPEHEPASDLRPVTGIVQAGQLLVLDPIPFADGTIVELVPMVRRSVSDGRGGRGHDSSSP